MNVSDDPRALEREIERVKRLAASVASDRTTYQRLRDFVEELKQRLHRRRAERRSKEAIAARSRELWELHGRPAWPMLILRTPKGWTCPAEIEPTTSVVMLTTAGPHRVAPGAP